ncbi:SDR family oxidoreductase [Tessaracoccus sp. MC1865]|uniref:SDR family oxidoreductase n=1 Tax=Tessaracoccus sp. MC1865 TaxID=2760310 RepID=UPI001600E27B|nr:SDR family oxidoreductase [Tessaracoccus sp. MC1865]MBB1483074.1 SDR family oxidoreductase [Tessaracoccus sp. MC1865]QTO37496.1 SDR family oxidoreductase [Tessaracoccus sp. MC1865]
MERADLTSIPSQQQEWPGRTADLNPQPDHGETSWIGRERLVGKRALITGGDSGIGRAVAIAFAKEGADVVISHLPQEEDDARDTVELIRAQGRTGESVASDLRDAQSNKELAAKAVQLLGGVDILVANAAYQMTHEDMTEFPDEQVERTFQTNVFGPFWLAKALADELKDGSIIITTSIQAFDPSENLLDYAATKAALNNMAVNMASELGGQNTRVNAVAPGPIWTPLIPATMNAKKVEGFGSDVPLGRAGHPIEVAAAFVFLASDEASYVSGTVLGVTGGRPVF